MNRDMTPAMQDAIAASSCRPVHLLELDFNPVICLTDAAVHLTWNNRLYMASPFLGFTEIQETRELLVTQCAVTLSGVDQTVIALLLADTYLGVRARIRKAFLTESLTVVVSPLLLIEGRLDNPVVTTDPEAGTCTASVTVVSRWSPLEKPAGRYTNSDTQQALFPGDLGFSNITDEQSTIILGGIPYIAPQKWWSPTRTRTGFHISG